VRGLAGPNAIQILLWVLSGQEPGRSVGRSPSYPYLRGLKRRRKVEAWIRAATLAHTEPRGNGV